MRGMAAALAIVDEAEDDPNRRFATINCCVEKGLFDHLVGTAEPTRRDGYARHPW